MSSRVQRSYSVVIGVDFSEAREHVKLIVARLRARRANRKREAVRDLHHTTNIKTKTKKKKHLFQELDEIG